MENINFINGAAVSVTDVRKSWTKIVKSVKESKKPAFVFTNNIPEAVVLSLEEYERLLQNAEEGKRRQLEDSLSVTYADFIQSQNLSAQGKIVAEEADYQASGENE